MALPAGRIPPYGGSWQLQNPPPPKNKRPAEEGLRFSLFFPAKVAGLHFIGWLRSVSNRNQSLGPSSKPGLTLLLNTWTENGKMLQKEGGTDAGKTKTTDKHTMEQGLCLLADS